MRTIYKIAKTELQLLFYSPIAWLLLLCFVVQTGSLFTDVYGSFVSKMAESGKTFRASSELFIQWNGLRGLWMQVQNFLYMYIPLLTMGVICKEYTSGTIKLLYSSPISSAQIVLGKFLAMVLFAGLFMLILLAYVIFAWCTIENFEAAWILTGWLGLFLLLCTYMAVGIFVSSLTSYQIIAAVGTFLVLMLLSMVGGWGQQYDFVRDITYWLSINNRANTFIDGMLCSEDLIYFPVIMAMFLALTVIRLNAVRQKQRFAITLRKNAIVVVLVCVAAWFSSRPALMGYCDTTSTQKNTLTPNSQEIIDKLDGGVTVTTYCNVLYWEYCMYAYPSFIMQNRQLFEKYTRFKPEMKLDVVYYWDESEFDKARGKYKEKSARQWMREFCEQNELDSNWLKTPEEINAMVDLSEEGHGFIRQIVRENGEKAWLRGTGQLSEDVISASFKRLVAPLPTVGFVTGHGERRLFSDEMADYGTIGNRTERYSLWNYGFNMAEVSLSQPIPEDVTILVLADMRSGLSAEEERTLKEYIDRGGNLLILGEPKRREVMNPLLRKYFGLELTPIVVGYDKTFGGRVTPDILACMPTKAAREDMYHIKGTLRVSMPTCSGIEQVEDKGFDTQVFVHCDTVGEFWTELETTNFVDDTVRFNPEEGEVSKVFPTLVGLSRKIGDKTQRILVAGDADMFSNNEFLLRRNIGAMNNLALFGCAYWLSEGEAPIDVRRPMGTDNRVFLSEGAYQISRRVIKWGIPVLMVGFAILLWIRRRGR